MTHPSLSICIATYNRARYIGETLESIIPQLGPETEIVIVDGASTDNTEEVVRSYAHRCPQIHYYRLPVKGGVDQDFTKAVELAQGHFCWLMSDDDILKPGAVRRILEEIQTGNFSLIIVNAEVRNVDLTARIDERRLHLTINRIYIPAEFEKLFADMASYLSFIGCVVIRRSVWMEREKEAYFGTSFIHVGVIFQHRLPANTLVIAEPLITIRYGNAEWTGRAFEIWMFKWPALIWSFQDLPDRVKLPIARKEPYRHYLTLLRYRAWGGYSVKDYKRIASLLGSAEKFAAALIARLPARFLNFLGHFYYSFFYRESRMPLLDIKNSPSYWLK